MIQGKITYLDGIRLHRGLTAGIHQVLSHQKHLNRINVFPVPDGDTGTNLGFTLMSIIDGTAHRVQTHAGETAVAIADAALDGARGNSGVILAQFMQGFSDSCAEHARLSLHNFAEAIRAGYEYARQALSEPMEGTILSVIKATAESLKIRVEAGLHDFRDGLHEALTASETALKHTPEQLEVLKKNGVVDAGGLGFVYILMGALDFIQEGSIRTHSTVYSSEVTVEAANESRSAPATDPTYRYCTECLVVGREIPLNKVREAVMELGDSLVVGGSKTRAKLHIHTNDPQSVFEVVRSFGEVTGEKADDMHRQVAVKGSARQRVAVVTDSTADLPPELVEELDIHVVPVKLNFGNKGYLDKVTITADEFYHLLTTSPHHPQTSQPTPGDFWRTYQYLTSHYSSVVSLHLPLAVSGTLQSAEMAHKRMPAEHIDVVDGVSTAGGLGLITLAAAQAAKAGKSHEEVLAAARKAAEETVIYAAIQDLAWAVKGGRVSNSRKRIADLLRATPVLGFTEESKVDMVGIFLGRKDLARGLAKWVAKRVNLNQHYTVMVEHAQCPEAAQRLLDLLPQYGYRIKQSYITDIGIALGAHAGPGALILALQPSGIA